MFSPLPIALSTVFTIDKQQTNEPYDVDPWLKIVLYLCQTNPIFVDKATNFDGITSFSNFR